MLHTSASGLHGGSDDHPPHHAHVLAARRRTSIAGGPLDDTLAQSDDEGAIPAPTHTGATRARSDSDASGASGSDASDVDDDDGEAYVPTRTALTASASRPVDILPRTQATAISARRPSLPKASASHSQRHSLTHALAAGSLLSPGSTASTASAASSAAASTFYSGFQVAPSSLPVNGSLTMLPAVPLQLGDGRSSSRRSSSPFVADALPRHDSGGSVSVAAGSMPASSYGRWPSAAPVMPVPAQGMASSASSSNTSPHGARGPTLTVAASSSYTLSAAARFLPPSGAHAYASPCTSGGPSPLPPRGAVSYSVLGSRRSISPYHNNSSPLPPAHSASPLHSLSPPHLNGNGSGSAHHMRAEIEEVVSYQDVARCPPHMQPSPVAPQAQRRAAVLRCATDAEVAEDEAMGLEEDFRRSSLAPPSTDTDGFELEFDM